MKWVVPIGMAALVFALGFAAGRSQVPKERAPRFRFWSPSDVPVAYRGDVVTGEVCIALKGTWQLVGPGIRAMTPEEVDASR